MDSFSHQFIVKFALFAGKDQKKRKEAEDGQFIKIHKGSGCGSVGRVVTSDTRGPRIESSHWQILKYYSF